MEITIRQAQPRDIEEMLVLLKELFSIEKDFAFDASKSRTGMEMLMADSSDGALLVACGNEQIVGMCSVQTLISTAEGQKAGFVEDLIVSKKFRRNRVATLLLNAVEDWAVRKGVKRLQLLADQINRIALDFYNSQSWSKTQLVCLRKYIEDV